MSNAGRKLASVVRLARPDQRRLEDYVQQHYVASGMTDRAFADKAADDLSLPSINANHIAGAREVFGLPSNRDVLRELAKSTDSLPARVAKLEHDLRALAAAFDVFKHGCRGDGK